MLPPDLTISVIIPAFNEEEGIPDVLHRIQALNVAQEIIVVDDGSRDNTAAVARDCGAIVVQHPYNIGNGAAVKAGIRAAKGDIVVMIDADGQHPPERIPDLLDKLDNYQMAVGSRTAKSNVSRFRSVGNVLMKQLAMYLTNAYIADLTSGFRAIYRQRLLQFIHLLPNSYSYPTTITMALLKEDYPIAWVPMDDIGKRKTGRSSIKPFRDGFRFVAIMLRIIMLFSPQKVFLPIGLAFLAVGFAQSIYTIYVGILQISAVMLVMIGVFVLLFGLIAEQLSIIRRELNS